MFDFIGVRVASTDEYMQYMIWRPVLRHDYLQSILVVESKHPGYCLAFVTRENGGDWMLLYSVAGTIKDPVLEAIVADAKHREEMLNRYDGAVWFAQWRL